MGTNMTTGLGNEWDPGDPKEIHEEAKLELSETHYTTSMPDENDPNIKLAEEHDKQLTFYTREQVCSKLGMNHSTLARWEQKKLISPAQRISGICVYTQVQLEEIEEVWKSSSRNLAEVVLCSNCNKRKAKKNSTLCSRCSYTALETQLRSTLPGMVKDEAPAVDTSISDAIPHIEEETDLTCPNCGSDDPNDRCMIVTGPEEFPISNLCNHEWHLQEPSKATSIHLDPEKTYYTRRQIAEAVGVSPTTICRWEQKGEIPAPLQSHAGKLFYTEEHLQKAKEFSTTLQQLKTSPIAHAAKGVGSKSFSRLAEKAVAIKIGTGGFRRGGLL